MADFQSKYSRVRWTPASVENPVYQTTPILMADPKTPHAVGAMDETGYFGIAFSSKQRIKKNTDKLARLHRKLLRIQEEIDETEDKLESMGVDVDDLYEDLGITPPIGGDEDDDVDPADPRWPGRRPGRGGRGGQEDPRLSEAEDDDEKPLSSAGFWNY